ncbi:nicotinamide riboside transporter PnuC [Paludisphaera rhizosphaerae]|uniref:nicotinamide riboside transporter PnuC n=1 Tax=Paludisphaera rhizosphaerae TaxID=2711216 RepID=UPI0013EB4BEB|nr:nicotinamide riboside transporter PnuC [Paludisphaera rhizosphaerae]
MPMGRGERRAAAILIGAAVLLALVMGLRGAATWLECASFVTGAACVWLTVKENVWNFPIGLVNVAAFGVVFLRAGLFADAGLQGVYLILCARGWYLWLHGGNDGRSLRITRAGAGELNALLVGVVMLTLLLWLVLRQVGGSASFWDALTTSLSLGAQWLLNRKRLESWAGWILVDAIYVPLYISKSLYLTAILYTVFLGLAIIGLHQWRSSWMSREDAGRTPEAVARPPAACGR